MSRLFKPQPFVIGPGLRSTAMHSIIKIHFKNILLISFDIGVEAQGKHFINNTTELKLYINV